MSFIIIALVMSPILGFSMGTYYVFFYIHDRFHGKILQIGNNSFVHPIFQVKAWKKSKSNLKPWNPYHFRTIRFLSVKLPILGNSKVKTQFSVFSWLSAYFHDFLPFFRKWYWRHWCRSPWTYVPMDWQHELHGRFQVQMRRIRHCGLYGNLSRRWRHFEVNVGHDPRSWDGGKIPNDCGNAEQVCVQSWRK